MEIERMSKESIENYYTDTFKKLLGGEETLSFKEELDKHPERFERLTEIKGKTTDWCDLGINETMTVECLHDWNWCDLDGELAFCTSERFGFKELIRRKKT